MGYKSELQSNNTDLQTILNTINALDGGITVETSTFVPTDSGNTGYQFKVIDNNIDLQKILELALSLPEAFPFVDFEGTSNGDGTWTLTAWKGTYNGEASTELVIPDDERIVLAQSLEDGSGG